MDITKFLQSQCTHVICRLYDAYRESECRVVSLPYVVLGLQLFSLCAVTNNKVVVLINGLFVITVFTWNSYPLFDYKC